MEFVKLVTSSYMAEKVCKDVTELEKVINAKNGSSLRQDEKLIRITEYQKLRMKGTSKLINRGVIGNGRFI